MLNCKTYTIILKDHKLIVRKLHSNNIITMPKFSRKKTNTPSNFETISKYPSTLSNYHHNFQTQLTYIHFTCRIHLRESRDVSRSNKESISANRRRIPISGTEAVDDKASLSLRWLVLSYRHYLQRNALRC